MCVRVRASPRGLCESCRCFTEDTLTIVAIDRYCVHIIYDDKFLLAKCNGGTTVNLLPSPLADQIIRCNLVRTTTLLTVRLLVPNAVSLVVVDNINV